MPAQPKSLNKAIIGIGTLLTAIIFSFAASPVHAIGTTAIPPRIDLKADPGQTIKASLKVRNDNDSQQLYTISVEDFIVADAQGTPIPVSSTNNRWSLSSWISAPDIIPVDANDTQIIQIAIKVPTTALAGGHYAMITYQPHGNIKPEDLKKTASLISQRVGTLIYLQVSGPITENASVIKFTTEKFHEKGPVDFNGTIRNLSEIHINPTGNITIYSPLNTKVAEVPVEVGNIFPEVNREFTSTWSQKWGYGKYRADLNLAYGTVGGVLTVSIYFWLFPIRLIINVLIAIISILVIIIILNKRSKKHQQDLEKEVQELKNELQQAESQNK